MKICLNAISFPTARTNQDDNAQTHVNPSPFRLACKYHGRRVAIPGYYDCSDQIQSKCLEASRLDVVRFDASIVATFIPECVDTVSGIIHRVDFVLDDVV